MESKYYKKYLKYRQKYLALKNQIGGLIVSGVVLIYHIADVIQDFLICLRIY